MDLYDMKEIAWTIDIVPEKQAGFVPDKEDKEDLMWSGDADPNNIHEENKDVKIIKESDKSGMSRVQEAEKEIKGS